MVALAYRDDKILARNLLSRPFFLFHPGGAILPPRPQSDCAIVSSGGQGWPRFSRPPEGLVLDGREHDGTLAVSERKTTMRGSGAPLVTTAILAASRFPFPQSLQKSGNSNREVHRLSRFRDHQTVCSCLHGGVKGGGKGWGQGL